MTFALIVVVQSLSHVRLFPTPWTAACALINGYFFFLKKLFIKKKLIAYLLAALGLRRCLRASHGGGFFCCRAQALGMQAR